MTKPVNSNALPVNKPQEHPDFTSVVKASLCSNVTSNASEPRVTQPVLLKFQANHDAAHRTDFMTARSLQRALWPQSRSSLLLTRSQNVSAAAKEESLASPPLSPGNQHQSLATGHYVCRILRRYHSVPQVAD